MIEHYEFGEYIIDGKKYKYDITIINGKIGTWSRDGHTMYVDNVEELVQAKPEYIIIGTGAYGALDVPSDVKKHIEENKIKLVVEKTGKACEEFNRLEKEGKKVCAIMHGTC